MIAYLKITHETIQNYTKVTHQQMTFKVTFIILI